MKIGRYFLKKAGIWFKVADKGFFLLKMVTSTEEEKVPHGVSFWGVSDKLQKVSGKNENW
ncbi:hypothetical protein FB550_10749 [Neobacillus bataviensis]|uniref:Uncharacterized protein n=1 Tax=Neobacillus bataviensis TaxID=220685 RepID=A0A561D7U1_9BACI|nr:hypothetical protein [Neobacillus bataviensis]TWD99414.1 hypothetical protein FB550_10749 [Neobacillus bataviensis]